MTNWKWFLLAIATVSGIVNACAQPVINLYTQPGVDVLHYRFGVTLTDADNHIQGETTIRFIRANGLTSVWFDLIGAKTDTATTGMRIRTVQLLNGQNVPFTHRNDRVYITLPTTATETQEVTIQYEGIPAQGLIISRNKFGDRTFFGDNWPNNARHWLPVIDHPSDKATCEFVVTAPAQYRVIANGQLVAETPLGNGLTQTHWREQAPIPTKVMVFGAAQFAVEQVGLVNSIPVQSWLYPKDSTKGFVDYRPAKAILQFFSDRIGPYSYEKLANVESTTTFGGMENASCIFYTERAIIGHRDTNEESLLAHEIAHQWFGNSASELDWSHIWLSEGFATYFSALYLEHRYGRDTLNKVLNANKAQVLSYETLRPDATIVDSTTRNLMGLLNPNSYQKGGWVLHMLRYELGEAVFWKGIRAYYQRFRNSNAQTRDFQVAMEETSGRSLNQFFRQWLYQPGHPELAWNWQYNTSKKAVVLTVNQVKTGRGRFVLPLVFSARTAAGKEIYRTPRLLLNQPTQRFTVPLARKPAAVLLDPDNQLLMKATQTTNLPTNRPGH